MLRALAKNGGVMGINFGEGFVNQQDADTLMKSVGAISFSQVPDLTGKALDDYAAAELRRDTAPVTVAATLDDVVAHIDHAVKVAGIDHVGIGSDFDGIGGPPKGLEDISREVQIAAALLKKGYSDEDVKKIMGGNTLRLIREVVGR
ncbi:MAG: membrane dipeptidase, partial [Acidobacteriota bacterium]|nr:membrane dipeptidase [Acidobacteriota bacterium]